jgi:hypothetical protein
MVEGHREKRNAKEDEEESQDIFKTANITPKKGRIKAKLMQIP